MPIRIIVLNNKDKMKNTLITGRTGLKIESISKFSGNQDNLYNYEGNNAQNNICSY